MHPPLNEPVVNAEWCGENAKWPPYLSGHDGFVKVTMQLARGMVRTQREIAAVHPAAVFVHVDAGFLYRGDGEAGWSSLAGASAWGAERLVWPDRWSVGHAARGPGDQPFRGTALSASALASR